MIIVVPSCLKDADGARARSDQNLFIHVMVKNLALCDHEMKMLPFYHVPFPWKGCGQHAVIKLVGWHSGEGDT
jgi:hypothetical protein